MDAGRISGFKSNATPNRPKKTTVAAATAKATGLPEEVFTKTNRGGIESAALQGRIAKKLGAKTSQVSVKDYGITLTGKALDKVRETGLKMAGQSAGELSNSPPVWMREGWQQVHFTSVDTPSGRQEMDFPSGIVSNPNPKSNPLSELTYLIAGGPKG